MLQYSIRNRPVARLNLQNDKTQFCLIAQKGVCATCFPNGGGMLELICKKT